MTFNPLFSFVIGAVAAILIYVPDWKPDFVTLFGEPATAKIMAVLHILTGIIAAISAILHLAPSKPDAVQFPLGPAAVNPLVKTLILAVALGAVWWALFNSGAFT